MLRLRIQYGENGRKILALLYIGHREKNLYSYVRMHVLMCVRELCLCEEMMEQGKGGETHTKKRRWHLSMHFDEPSLSLRMSL